MKRKILISLVLAVLLVALVSSMASATDIVVTATPSYISFSSSSTQWDLNDLIDGDGLVEVDTIYYANPLGDEDEPSATVLTTECLWNWTNASTVNIHVYVDCSAFVDGDANMTPSADGENGENICGCYSWVAGELYSAKQVMQTSGSAAVYTTTTPGDDRYWGAQIETRTNDWTGNTPSTATISITIVPV